MKVHPETVIAALRGREDGIAVLPLLGARTAVVGGFVRDALLERQPREIDLLVEGAAAMVARELADRSGGMLTSHTRFDTHTVRTDRWQVDVAAARTETYGQPGALPDVRPAGITEDLSRRDFTVNAIALTDGGLVAAPWAFEDLAGKQMRVLHGRSFHDDPTRLVRLARYAERLGFDVEPRTAQLAAAGVLDKLSPARLGAELRLALNEPDPAAVLGRLALGFDPALAGRALDLAPPGADRGLIQLAACLPVPAIELTSREQRVLQRNHAALARAMQACVRASELWLLLRGEADESVALAGAHGVPEVARWWFSELRDARLAIRGEDLLAAGIPPGPRVGALLHEAMLAQLDGELESGRQAQLRFALASNAR